MEEVGRGWEAFKEPGMVNMKTRLNLFIQDLYLRRCSIITSTASSWSRAGRLNFGYVLGEFWRLTLASGTDALVYILVLVAQVVATGEIMFSGTPACAY